MSGDSRLVYSDDTAPGNVPPLGVMPRARLSAFNALRWKYDLPADATLPEIRRFIRKHVREYRALIESYVDTFTH